MVGSRRPESGSLRPFQQLRFSQLPAQPWRPHPYDKSTAHELEMDSVGLGRLRIHYREYGSGDPLLLIHGLMTSSYSWRYMLDDLGARYRLIVPDLPGTGASSAPAVRLSAAALAEWIGEFQTALGLRGCAAVGNSLGGYLCMRRALADPAAFSRLVNIHSPAFPMPRLHALRAALSLPGAGALLGWWIRRDPQRWAHRLVHYYDESLKSLEEARAYGDPLAAPDGTSAFVGYLRDVMRPRDFAEFAAVLEQRQAQQQPFPIPLMLLYSYRDPLVPPAVGNRLAALISDARLQRLGRASHFVHVDRPGEVANLLLDFLRPEATKAIGAS
jgi:pimeloyl-ACP methyl ester carboxylesterase